MNWHNGHRTGYRQWARCPDGTFYAIYPTAGEYNQRWAIHRRSPGAKYDTAIGDRRTLAEARECAEADYARLAG